MSWTLEATYGRLLVRPEYLDVAQDLAAGMLLSQIVYWFRPSAQGKTKLSIYREGRWWLAKSAVEWCSELRIGRKPYLRSLQILVDLKIVEKRLWLFQGHPTLHLSLDLDRVHELVAQRGKSIVPLGDTPLSPTGTNHCPQSVQSSTESTAETTAENGVQGTQGQAVPTLKQILEEKAKDQHQLPAVWKAEMAEAYGGFQQQLTGKEMGQLKTIRLWLIEQQADPVEVVRRWIREWSIHATYVRAELALKDSPGKPHIGWCMQYRAELLNSLAAQHKPVVPVQSIAPAPAPKAEPQAEDKPTPEQIAALLKLVNE